MKLIIITELEKDFSDTWSLECLCATWYRLLDERTVLVVDGVKQAKEAFYMLGVKNGAGIRNRL